MAKKDTVDVLKEAQARFDVAIEAEAQNRAAALEDYEFTVGKQWPENIRADRERDGRPCLVINKLPQFIQQITNDQRQNRPSIKVQPVDDKADVETAKVIQGLVRHIEYNSNAEIAYDTAFDGAVRGGFGYFRIVPDYISPNSFQQELYIKRIQNPFSVFYDPFITEPDGSDASWAFVTEDLSRDEYMHKYPNSKLAAMGEWEATGNASPLWMPDGSARVAEYFYKTYKNDTLLMLSDGQTVLKSELGRKIIPEGVVITAERETTVPVIKWAKINGCEILEETVWPGKYIPIIPVYGNEINVNGVRILEGIVRNSKDPAKMYNYWASAETEAIALAPRAPFIVAEGQLEGYEGDWETSNRRNHATLTYKPTSLNGQPVAPPQRSAFEPAVQAITMARAQANEDIKATTGIYDASLGSRSNETSGVAIQRRNIQAQTSNFHFIDNLSRSLRHAGRVLINLIPYYYDTPMVARIIGEDGEQRIVKLNQPFIENGKEMIYAMDVGQYDVVVDVGPSFQSKRQEAVASMMELSKAVPGLMQIAGDLLVKSMDWPGASEIAERMKKSMPPELVEDMANKVPVPPHVQAQMQQMGAMIEQMTAKINELQDEKEKDLISIQSKERIEFAKLETQATIELAKLESAEGLRVLSYQIAELDQRTKMLGVNQPFDMNVEQDEQLSMEPVQGQMPMQNPIGGVPPSTNMGTM